MQQQDRRADRRTARREFDDVQAASVDRDHATCRRVGTLNASDANRCDDYEAADNR
jgi:hypothetical protein